MNKYEEVMVVGKEGRKLMCVGRVVRKLRGLFVWSKDKCRLVFPKMHFILRAEGDVPYLTPSHFEQLTALLRTKYNMCVATVAGQKSKEKETAQ